MVLLLISVSDVGPNNLKHQIETVFTLYQSTSASVACSEAHHQVLQTALLFRAIPICSIIRAFIYPRLSDLTCFCRLQAAMCYVHVAALVAEYLRRKGTSVFCDGNVSPAY